jgi:two-component system, response regulator PdtaR
MKMSKLRILIVEDEAVTSADLHDELIAQGYEVMGIASTAEAALKMAMEGQPDLTLMDINLSGATNGIAAARALRERDIPIIFLTAHYDERTLAQAKLTSPVGYITKPFDPHQIGVAIEIGIARHRSDLDRIRLARELEHERLQGKTLRSLLPFCVRCKAIRDDEGYWSSIEAYLSNHSDLTVSHGLCPACARKLVVEIRRDAEAGDVFVEPAGDRSREVTGDGGNTPAGLQMP